MNAHEQSHSLARSPGLPVSGEGDPVFAEPWQAEAFAMTVRLHEKGVFSWSEWAETLSQELYRPGRRPDGADYYECWVAALSRLVTELSITSEGTLDRLTQSWQRAAEATPHGHPILLENDPQR
ncbi:nitrile hydratase accessory protein [Rhizobium sp. Root482]|uniref:nitrile hydratase accessory protein n=1 Tax=Rhizobium sp. Root482 TaxID=1736543 RepID=UPI0006FBC032|nr:nitrile hydratase accessory protein [Rhizobium sp. Root482]KQY26993.1 nitrile hydratase [Rhizobium sp. Root482]